MSLEGYTDEELRDELEKRAGADLCAYCGEVAKYLCDGLKRPEVGRMKKLELCSRPLCDDHRVNIGQSIDLYGPGVVESLDRCPDCQAFDDALKAGGGPPHRGGGRKVKARKAA